VFLVFGGEEDLVVMGYNDASFQTDATDSKSQSSFVFCLNEGAVSWKRSNQDIVIDSMMLVEYVADSKGVWIINFVFELGVVPSASSPMNLYCDNSGAIVQVKMPRAYKRVNTCTTSLPSHPRNH
jgi:hypothetical protein